MFVRTQFDTIVNLSEFQKIKIEWSVKQDTGNVFHVILAESNTNTVERQSGTSTQTSKSATLAQFPQDEADQAGNAYLDLFNALLAGETAFDMTADDFD